MKPARLVSPLQRAWLEEIGVDTHWLSAPPASEPPAARPAAADPVTGRPATERAIPPPPAVAARPAREPSAAPDRPASAPVDPVVQGSGVRERPLYCIVGEQPGIEDVAEPFQGDQGRLLRAMLVAARLPQPESVYLTTLVKDRSVGARAPTPEEIAARLPALREEILGVRPRWILALGGVAARALLGSEEPLEALRGGPYDWTGPDGTVIPVWVTHHPSSLLVRSADKPAAWRDLVALGEAVRAAELS
jgi:DNA polymerase